MTSTFNDKTPRPSIVQTPPPINSKTELPTVIEAPNSPKPEPTLPTSAPLHLSSLPEAYELVPVDLKDLKIDSKFTKPKNPKRPRPPKILTSTTDPKKHPNPHTKPTQDREDTKQIKGNKRKQIDDS